MGHGNAGGGIVVVVIDAIVAGVADVGVGAAGGDSNAYCNVAVRVGETRVCFPDCDEFAPRAVVVVALLVLVLLVLW